ncbi:MAG: hypothetical protein ABSG38_16130 [Spirochaetia bacterium]
MPFIDLNIGAILRMSNPGYLNFEVIFNHSRIAEAITGRKGASLGMGFALAPPEVLAALRSGEMRYLQKLAGYAEVRFRPDGSLESTTAVDGWKKFYSEQSKGPIAAQYLNGEIEPIPPMIERVGGSK